MTHLGGQTWQTVMMEFGTDHSWLNANGLTPQTVFQTLLIQRVTDGNYAHLVTQTFDSLSDWDEVVSTLSTTAKTQIALRGSSVSSRLNVAFFERKNSVAVLTQDYWGEWELIVAVNTDDEASRWVEGVAALLPAPPPPPPIELPHNVVPVMFWMQDNYGGASYRRRNIEVTDWDEIEPNYPTGTREQIASVMGTEEPDGEGKLMLFHGPPGTGKTRAILSLMSEWRDWCFSSVVTDADRLLGNPTYLNELLFGIEGRGDYLLLIIEDGDEFVNVDEQSSKGQALSRILNMADGIMGQGLNMLTLISTNVAVDKLNPAMARPGRCMANIHFPGFKTGDALAWLKNKVDEEALAPELLQMLAEKKYGQNFTEASEGDTPASDFEFTLAELYEILRGD